jgi:hypothetical protein
MPQLSFGSNQQAVKILDAGPEGAFVVLQVLDASVLFFDKTKETLVSDGAGLAAPNTRNGFQLKSANGLFVTWWEGEMWGRSDTAQGLICAAVVFQKKKCGCGGEKSADSQPGFDEGV